MSSIQSKSAPVFVLQQLQCDVKEKPSSLELYLGECQLASGFENLAPLSLHEHCHLLFACLSSPRKSSSSLNTGMLSMPLARVDDTLKVGGLNESLDDSARMYIPWKLKSNEKKEIDKKDPYMSWQ